MPLVEIIVGKQTSDETIARALDYVGQLRKTPIVVNDSRGFYTSRVFGSYTFEGQTMLAEGIDAALIESAGKLAGMPVGPLAVTDEVSLELQYNVESQTRADLGAKYKERVSWPVLKHFVEDLKRVGRKGGAGFYDYPAGGKKVLWEGLRREYPQLEKQPAVEELKTRLLYIQALETARCFEEGVLRSAHEADLGSILGWGFPAYTGGTLSFIDTVGPARIRRRVQAPREALRRALQADQGAARTRADRRGLLRQRGARLLATGTRRSEVTHERSPPRTARSRRDRHAESSRVAERLHGRPATGLEKGIGGGRRAMRRSVPWC